MPNFNDRGGKSRFNDSKPAFGGSKRFSKPGFSKKPWEGGKSGDRPMTLYKATCAECGKTCEVPFRPVSGKPVYCKDCFAKQGGNTGENRFSAKRDFNARPARPFPTPRFERNDEAITKQFEVMNSKLDRLLRAVEVLAVSKITEAEETKEGLKDVLADVSKRNPKKKTVKK